jgi:hypothetical protein
MFLVVPEIAFFSILDGAKCRNKSGSEDRERLLTLLSPFGTRFKGHHEPHHNQNSVTTVTFKIRSTVCLCSNVLG